jgi:hypothetical protein
MRTKERIAMALLGLLILCGVGWDVCRRVNWHSTYRHVSGQATVVSTLNNNGAVSSVYRIAFEDSSGQIRSVPFAPGGTLDDDDGATTGYSTRQVTVCYDPQRPTRFYLPGYLFPPSRIFILGFVTMIGIAIVVGSCRKEA